MIVNHVSAQSIITKTAVPAGDYVVNPYVGCPHRCIYCYAEFMKRFTNHTEKWGDFLDVKHCERLPNPARLAKKTVLFSSVTDAYNPFEKKFCKTRGLLSCFVNSEVHIEILTKSALVLRDIDIFKQIPHINVGISMNTLDDSIRKKLEPGASSIEDRLNAVRTLHKAGLKTYIFLSPMFPGITDFKSIIQASKSFTNKYTFENLNLRGAYRPRVFAYIQSYHPYLLPLYNDIYVNHNNAYWETLEHEIMSFCNKEEITWHSWFYHEKIRKPLYHKHGKQG